jgi:hypothetical protein
MPSWSIDTPAEYGYIGRVFRIPFLKSEKLLAFHWKGNPIDTPKACGNNQ